MNEFVNRYDELSLLEEEWGRPGGRFIVVHGRRRIGKTRLIKEFTKNKTGIFYVAGDSNSKIQLNEFKDAAATFFRDDFLRSIDISSWKMMFDYLEKVISTKEERIYLWMDEFSYLLKNDKTIVSSLQIFIDHKEIKTYFSILNAIAYGNTKPSEIASFVGINAREIYPYLDLLINYGILFQGFPGSPEVVVP